MKCEVSYEFRTSRTDPWSQATKVSVFEVPDDLSGDALIEWLAQRVRENAAGAIEVRNLRVAG
ncbi:MAG: hypothetical protein KIT17_00940 [Rubrivivax sp.]|nr:hypothetical protein [Rubrivivax sp.]